MRLLLSCAVYKTVTRKMASTRVIHKAAPVREESVLRKVVKKYYAVKAIVLVQQKATRMDLEEFINITLQIGDKVSFLVFLFFVMRIK